MNGKTREFRQKIADIFIKSLNEKQLKWKKEWNGPAMSPMNAISHRRYKGINQFWLGFVALEKGYDDPRWCTFLQVQNQGWKLQGAKGTGVQVEYWLPYDFEKRKAMSWEAFNLIKHDKEALKDIAFIAKYFTVFNAKFIEGIPPLPEIQTNAHIRPDEIIDKLAKNMEVQIFNDGKDRAYYSTLTDQIHLPKPEYFVTEYAYNATALHELAHATGAAHRLNRNIMNMFGSSDYAYEELIAEISSCFMSVNLKVEHDQNHINNHKAYVQSWIQAIKEKPNILIQAIREAEKTANYMDFKAEIISEKEYLNTTNESLEVEHDKVMGNEKTFIEMKQDISNILAREGFQLLLCDEDIKDYINERAYMDLATYGSSKDLISQLKRYLESHILKEEPSMLEAIKAKGQRAKAGKMSLSRVVER
ncbi:ArdC family protein [Clostridium formicaceticum]|uniref:DNA primase TraC n=1 Tax=Clostridium formicaceticum TaxID=1497 RepID=A0AAC9RP12_9CLOT|nr:zincin-like metallopeptidase domain-containing protein [Clostridium formicaceticum]AOY74731.1 hypothetical protein BJL90_01435 [Clostridium formicaceticum]ARE89117.1 DNA primase TraC [Clostridium formicaceticum]